MNLCPALQIVIIMHNVMRIDNDICMCFPLTSNADIKILRVLWVRYILMTILEK